MRGAQNTARDARIIKLRMDGSGPSEIAANLGLGVKAVNNVILRARKLGLLAGEVTLRKGPKLRDAILALRAQNMSFSVIAEELGITKGMVAGVCDRASPRSKRATVGTVPRERPTVPGPEKKIRCAVVKAPEIIGIDLAASPSKTIISVVERRPDAATVLTSYELGLATLDDVQASGGCRWPHGDPRAADFHFCGAPREDVHLPFIADPEPYCATHRQKCRSKERRTNIHGLAYLR